MPNGAASQTASTPAFRDITYNQATQSFALFGNSTYKFTDKFKVTGGLRWTSEEKDIDLNLTQITTGDYTKGSWWKKDGYSNAVYNPTPNANGSTSRNKTWNELTYDITPEYEINPNLNTY